MLFSSKAFYYLYRPLTYCSIKQSPVKIKFTNSDPYGFKQNKFIKFSFLFIGIILFLLGGTGFIVDLLFPSFSTSYHGVAGESNGGRLLIGIFLLLGFYSLRKKQ